MFELIRNAYLEILVRFDNIKQCMISKHSVEGVELKKLNNN
jgi:hypothetical protein